jgi:hypothetical protein
MKRLLLAASVLLAAPVVPASAEEFICAHKIETTQSLKAAPQGWSACRDPNDQIFESITLFDGEPAEGNVLAPASADSSPATSWTFTPKKGRVVWMQCNYRQTAMRLSRPLPEKITKCAYNADAVSNVLTCE